MDRMFRPLLPLLLLLSGAALAQPALSAYLEPVSRHPALTGLGAQILVREAALAQARDPFTISLNAGTSRMSISDDARELPDFIADLLVPPEAVSELGIQLSLRPVPFGDMRDLLDQTTIELALAELDRRETLTGLQVSAVEAALNYRLAEEGLALAEEAVALSGRALEATRLRHGLGAANDRDVREAELQAAEAASLLATARSSVALALSGVQALAGNAPIPERDELMVSPPAEGEPLGLTRARLQAELVLVGARNARRSVLPVVQASYTRFLDDQNSLGLSLESRTLQPTFSYSWSSMARSFPETYIEGVFTIGLSASFSPAVMAALRASEGQEAAAVSIVAAAESQAGVELQALEHELAAARGRLEVADLARRAAEVTLQEATERELLGLGTELEQLAAANALTRADLELSQARLAATSAALAFHTHTGRPLLEETPE